MNQNLARARNNLGLGMRPGLASTARGVGAFGVGAARPYFGSPMAMRPAVHPAVQQALNTGLVAPVQNHPMLGTQFNPGAAWTLASAARPAMHIADRSEWSKIYQAIELPVDSTILAPSGIVPTGSLSITVTPLISVWITNFQADSQIPSDFLVTLLQVGRLNLLGASGGVPASRWRQDARLPGSNIPAQGAGAPGIVAVKNINPASTLSFHGSFQALDTSMPLNASL